MEKEKLIKNQSINIYQHKKLDGHEMSILECFGKHKTPKFV